MPLKKTIIVLGIMAILTFISHQLAYDDLTENTGEANAKIIQK